MLEYLKKHTLLKVASLNSLNIIVKIITGLFVSKVLATLIGPQGIALVGNLRDFSRLSLNISSLGLETGILRESSKLKADKSKMKSMIANVFFLSGIASFVVMFFLFFYSEEISLRIFNTKVYSKLIVWVSITLPFYVIHLVLLKWINGISKYNKVIWINMFSHILNFILMVYLTYRFQIEGALYVLIIAPIAYLIINLIFIKKEVLDLLGSKAQNFKFVNNNKELFRYSIVYLPAAIIFPFVYIYVRNYIHQELSLQNAGFYEALNRISNNYMMFVYSLFSLYLLPELVGLNKIVEIKSKILHFYKNILPAFILGVSIIFFLKKNIVLLLYSKEFTPVIMLFKWQIIGDVLRVLSLAIVMYFHANKKYLMYIISDLFQAFSIVLFTTYFVDRYGLEGAAIAHMFTYIVYFIVVIILFKYSNEHSNNNN